MYRPKPVSCDDDPDDPDCTVSLPNGTAIPWDLGSGGGDNDGGWINPYDTGGQTGGGTPPESPTPEKLDYCEALDELNAFLSSLPITGTAATGYSIAELSAGIFRNILLAAYRDITTFISSGVHPDHYGNGVIQWNEVNINWNDYNNWPGIGVPNSRNGGAQHIFANFVETVGAGNGSSILTDPQPDADCP